MSMDWLNFSQIIADSPRQIRRGDVYRFLDEADQTVFGASEAADWLREQRPDLTNEIATCLTDIVEGR